MAASSRDVLAKLPGADATVRPGSGEPAGGPISTEQVWVWLSEVMDPEIPVISIVDLGIVRDVRRSGVDDQRELVVTLTPTYSGCPATEVIRDDVRDVLRAHGVGKLQLRWQLSPAWTTDWLSETGRQRLLDYGIAPPARDACSTCAVHGLDAGVAQLWRATHRVKCPHCGSARTRLVSEAGSTRCKALYVCADCREPFDYFKPH
ncbi:MAG: 1,2-phenylacetyl-CoA epoxidase subunit PaaD [Rhodanobacteraceae bacterium]